MSLDSADVGAPEIIPVGSGAYYVQATTHAAMITDDGPRSAFGARVQYAPSVHDLYQWVGTVSGDTLAQVLRRGRAMAARHRQAGVPS